ncbi:MAG: cytochrome C [Chlorobi bacterium]|nr:cytochrome C [Chlorobiota bacterium]
MKLKLPRSTHNWTTVAGATIASISFFLILFLFIISVVLNQGGSYIGLIIYIILPSFLVLGLILIPIGMLRYRSKFKDEEGDQEKRLPYIDLNIPRHRNAFMIFIAGTVILLFISAIGSYEAFHYSESVQFCGTTCHNVMIPEYTAYQNSPHARVRCVECHVGSGVNWYIRSKLSGLRQVYKVITNTVPKPIETPIKNLRPARETCEECHWPQKFYARTFRTNRHYLRDEENTEWDIGLEIKVGSELSAFGLKEGIHWHINPDVKIQYAATDEKRQDIPWVKYINQKTGKEIIFESEDEPLAPNMIDSLEIRTIDCIDCHNRPSHKYYAPEYFINDAITAGNISKDLPEIKSIAIEVCSEKYNSTDSAMIGIQSNIEDFYKENYPEVIEDQADELAKAIVGVQNEFKQNIFPEMKVRWDEYPINIGHIKSKGCFRCHDDNHVSESGDVITKSCDLCHSIVMQGQPSRLQKTTMDSTLTFIHPGEDVEEDDWRESLCSDCHEGDGP